MRLKLISEVTEELGTDQEFLGDLTTRCAEKKKESRGLIQSTARTLICTQCTSIRHLCW